MMAASACVLVPPTNTPPPLPSWIDELPIIFTTRPSASGCTTTQCTSEGRGHV